jgi:hypothetical protein
MSRRCSGSRLDNSRLCTSRGLLGTLLRRPLAYFPVRFVRCVTGHAAHDSAREGAVTAQMACDTASECACDAAFGNGDTWSERNLGAVAGGGWVESFACAYVIAAFKSNLSTVSAKLERGKL